MICQFALRLICGLAAAWCGMPRADVTCGFFRIQFLVALGLSVLAGLTAADMPGASSEDAWLSAAALRGICGGLAALSFAGSVLWTLARRPSGGAAAGGALLLSAVGLLGSLPRTAFDSPGEATLRVGSELAAAGILGGGVAAMLLGHWYLTAPMMKLRPLERVNQWFAGAVLLRGLLAAGALSGAAVSTELHGLWLAMRWACGIIAPLGLTFLVTRILRLRNTQAATGVLFAAVILVFLGETAALVLSRDLGWPL